MKKTTAKKSSARKRAAATANTTVTGAIVSAEQILDHAIIAWKAVRDAEDALTTIAESDNERHIASRGVGRAETIIDILKALRGAS